MGKKSRTTSSLNTKSTGSSEKVEKKSHVVHGVHSVVAPVVEKTLMLKVDVFNAFLLSLIRV